MKTGDVFTSWDDVFNAVQHLSDVTFSPFIIGYARTTVAENRRRPEMKIPWPEDVKYSGVQWLCTHRGKFKPRGTGLKNRGSHKADCKAEIFVSLDKKTKTMHVQRVNTEHNHEIVQHFGFGCHQIITMADSQESKVDVKDNQSSSSSSAPQTPVIEMMPNGTSWDKAAILKLIQLHKEHQHLFDNPYYKKKSVWDMIVAGLQGQGFDYTLVQVENKWKSLTKKYRDAVDHNAKHGSIDSRRCAFFTELSMAYEYTSPLVDKDSTQCSAPDSNEFHHDDIAYSDIDVTPPAAHTSMARRMKRKAGEANLRSSVALGKIKKKCHPEGEGEGNDVDKILHLLHVMNEDRKKQEQERMEKLEKMHQEKLSVFKEFLSVLKSVEQQSQAKECKCKCRCDSCNSNLS